MTGAFFGDKLFRVVLNLTAIAFWGLAAAGAAMLLFVLLEARQLALRAGELGNNINALRSLAHRPLRYRLATGVEVAASDPSGEHRKVEGELKALGFVAMATLLEQDRDTSVNNHRTWLVDETRTTRADFVIGKGRHGATLGEGMSMLSESVSGDFYSTCLGGRPGFHIAMPAQIRFTAVAMKAGVHARSRVWPVLVEAHRAAVAGVDLVPVTSFEEAVSQQIRFDRCVARWRDAQPPERLLEADIDAATKGRSVLTRRLARRAVEAHMKLNAPKIAALARSMNQLRRIAFQPVRYRRASDEEANQANRAFGDPGANEALQALGFLPLGAYFETIGDDAARGPSLWFVKADGTAVAWATKVSEGAAAARRHFSLMSETTGGEFVTTVLATRPGAARPPHFHLTVLPEATSFAQACAVHDGKLAEVGVAKHLPLGSGGAEATHAWHSGTRTQVAAWRSAQAFDVLLEADLRGTLTHVPEEAYVAIARAMVQEPV